MFLCARLLVNDKIASFYLDQHSSQFTKYSRVCTLHEGVSVSLSVHVFFLFICLGFCSCLSVLSRRCDSAGWRETKKKKKRKQVETPLTPRSPSPSFTLFYLLLSLSLSHTHSPRTNSLVVAPIAPLILDFFFLNLIYHVTVVSKWNVFTATH